MALQKIWILLLALLTLWWITFAQSLWTWEEIAPVSSEESLMEDEFEEDLFDDDLLDNDLFGDDDFVETTWSSTEELLDNDIFSENETLWWWWGFLPQDEIIVAEQWEDYVVLSAPIVLDWNWNQIKIYKLIYSDKPISENDPLELKEMKFEYDTFESDKVEMRLEWLVAWTKYFAVITPFNKDDVEWEATSEFNFTPWAHWAALVNITWVSYKVEWSNVTLSWTPANWADKIEIFTRNEQEKDFTKIWEVSWNVGSYQYTIIAKPWTYFAKLIPVDWQWAPVWPELIQTIKIDDIVEVEAEKVPQVWPATNAMIAIIVAFMMWYAYLRIRKYSK